MIENLSFINKWTLEEYIRYEHEIVLDSHEMILKEEGELFKSSILIIKAEFLHHMIDFHYQIILNFLHFKQKNILRNYLVWLYRVYYHRGLDFDFLLHFFWIMEEITCKYIDEKASSQIKLIYEDIIADHNYFKREAKKAKYILDNEDEVTALTNLLLKGYRKEVLDIFETKCNSLDDFCDFEKEIFAPAMKKVGWLWESNEISVAKEHIASSTADDVIFSVLNSFKEEEPKGINIIITNSLNENHSLGNKIVSKLLQKYGYNIINLGGDITKKDLLKAIEEFNPDYIIFGATLTTSLYDIAMTLKYLSEYKFVNHFKTIIGGSGFETLMYPVKSFEVDYYAKSLKDLISYLDN